MVFTLNAFGLSVAGCSSDHSNTKSIQHQVSSTTTPVVPVPVQHNFKYPYNEKGEFIFASDKEFHQKDCAGYRSYYGIEKLILPCESDIDLLFDDGGYSSRSYSSVYINYRGLDSESFNYSTKITLFTRFLSEHDSDGAIIIEGPTTWNVLAPTSVSIFLWNYQDRRWKNTPELFVCDSYELTRFADDVEDEKEVSITCFLLNADHSNKMNAIIHNEEVFQVRMTTYEVDTGKRHEYYIPTPTFRKYMHRAWRHR